MKKLPILILALSSAFLIDAQVAKEFADHHQQSLDKAAKDQKAYADLENEQTLLMDKWPSTQGAEFERINKRLMEILVAQNDLASTLLSDLMDSWVGLHSDRLLAKWGPPDATFKDTQGNTIWTYTRLGGFGVDTHETRRQFYIDKNHIVFNWRWEGL